MFRAWSVAKHNLTLKFDFSLNDLDVHSVTGRRTHCAKHSHTGGTDLTSNTPTQEAQTLRQTLSHRRHRPYVKHSHTGGTDLTLNTPTQEAQTLRQTLPHRRHRPYVKHSHTGGTDLTSNTPTWEAHVRRRSDT